MKTLRYFALILVTLTLASCENAFMEPNCESDPVTTFDYLWNKVDQQYAFFDVKGVDWDEVYQRYRPMVQDGMDDQSLFQVCADMLNTLCDGHTNLISSFDVSRNDTVYYKMLVEKNINPDVVSLNYLTLNYQSTAGFAHNFIRNGEVAYVRYSSFSNTIDYATMNYIAERYKNCRGMIIDLRQNGGGAIANIPVLLSLFNNHGQELYRTQIKSGPGHDEFTDMAVVYASDPASVEDPSATSSFLEATTIDVPDYFHHKPVAVLIDRGSFSATSFFAICTMAYPNVKLIGDYSGGGLGLPNGGELPNGWTYRFSITRTLAIDGQNYENGVPPDYRVLLDPAATAQGLDNIIETAADWILR